MEYLIELISGAPHPDADWADAFWRGTKILEVANFYPESSDHHPEVRCRLGYDAAGIYGRFIVVDRYVRSVATRFQDQVCHDSCVEFFVEPAGGRGYVNFEINCGGTLLAYHITDHRRRPGGFEAFAPLTVEQGARVKLYPTLPQVNDPEIAEPTVWQMGFFIPFAVLQEATGCPAPQSGTVWRANFFKCGDRTSHPHWASWSPLHPLNFHQPEFFGDIRFA